MNKPKVLVVGINSFVGRHLVPLLSVDYEVFGAYHKNLDQHIAVDHLLTLDELDRVAKVDISVVVILSAYIPYIQTIDDTDRLYEANVRLVDRICRHFERAKIVYASTVSIYDGIADARMIDEFTSVSTSTPYSLSKLWGEQIVKQRANHAILRLSSIYGQGMTNLTFIPRIVDQALANGKITLYGKGERLQNYLHVEDAASMFLRLTNSDAQGVFIGGSPLSYSNLVVAKEIQSITNCQIEFVSEDTSSSFNYRTGKIQRLLGQHHTFKDIKEGLREIIKWKQKQY